MDGANRTVAAIFQGQTSRYKLDPLSRFLTLKLYSFCRRPSLTVRSSELKMEEIPMSEPAKRCPECQNIVLLDTAFCDRCRHQFRTKFASPAASAPVTDNSPTIYGTSVPPPVSSPATLPYLSFPPQRLPDALAQYQNALSSFDAATILQSQGQLRSLRLNLVSGQKRRSRLMPVFSKTGVIGTM